MGYSDEVAVSHGSKRGVPARPGEHRSPGAARGVGESASSSGRDPADYATFVRKLVLSFDSREKLIKGEAHLLVLGGFEGMS
ncbi:hypothetical protein Tpen_1643 [Thermofilum pendens Hrk 5]|uniref:Uncharacterized protein n=1 Tax=Thermofilum pendens (strain DSM 2475 / Hrk 5) TaxID=368408 RepID=A1S0Q8_THEPD|nr:hypothetical protein Tpen_1643 [Thermofilum pendens Hrk 5]